ncbi:hypothetical protein KM043_004174 [Ampulex compressa]|nr:hypothetical protein KM043_004174 [Ampulex compressa]
MEPVSERSAEGRRGAWSNDVERSLMLGPREEDCLADIARSNDVPQFENRYARQRVALSDREVYVSTLGVERKKYFCWFNRPRVGQMPESTSGESLDTPKLPIFSRAKSSPTREMSSDPIRTGYFGECLYR